MAASIPALLLTILDAATKGKVIKLTAGTLIALTGTLSALQLETVRWLVAEQLNVPNITTDLLYWIYYTCPYPASALAYALKSSLVNFHWIF